MIKKQNVTKEMAISLNHRFGATMFGVAPFLGIWFDDAEIKYIETKMITHKLYRFVAGLAGGLEGSDHKLRPFQEIWLLNFLNDPKIPRGVRGFILAYTREYRGELKVEDDFDNTHRHDIFVNELFLKERWMEKCR